MNKLEQDGMRIRKLNAAANVVALGAFWGSLLLSNIMNSPGAGLLVALIGLSVVVCLNTTLRSAIAGKISAPKPEPMGNSERESVLQGAQVLEDIRG